VVQAFLFDLDGTLVDTHQANFEAYKKAFAHFDVRLTWEQFKPSIGRQAKVFVPILAPGLTEAQYAEIRDLKAKYYKGLLHLTQANGPLIELMRSLAMHYPTALVTTAQLQNANAILEHHRLADIFKIVITAADVEHAKPHPEGYVTALKQLGVQADDALAFEDSETGRQAAEAAGISVIMIKDFAV
jgi:HAD superfamily hydrolase (TIGR01509 family)